MLRAHFSSLPEPRPPTSCGKKKVSIGKCDKRGKAKFSIIIPTRFFGKCLRVHFRGTALCRSKLRLGVVVVSVANGVICVPEKGKKCSSKVIHKRSSKCFLGGRYRLEFEYRYKSKGRMCLPYVRFHIKRCSKLASVRLV